MVVVVVVATAAVAVALVELDISKSHYVTRSGTQLEKPLKSSGG